jgi:hypothetical protein
LISIKIGEEPKKVIISILFLLLVACSTSQSSSKGNADAGSYTACEQDSDCACGTSISTGDCFVGNAKYVNTEKQCPDFCTGIAGNFQTQCVEKQCRLVNTNKK